MSCFLGFGRRMRGDGKFAELIRMQMALARKKFFEGRAFPEINYGLYEEQRNKILSEASGENNQLKLF